MEFFLHTLAHAFMAIPTILGYNLVFGKGKILHFGQEAIALAAVYAVWVPVMLHGAPLGVGIVLGTVAAVVMALALAWLSFRLDADGLGVMSIALHLAALAVALNWQPVTRGALGIPRIARPAGMEDLQSFTIVMAVVAVLWIIGMYWLDRGPFGRALVALSEHSWHAEALGIRRRRIHTIAFLITGIGALVTNFFFPMYLHLLSPSDFGFPITIFFVTIIVAGGPGSLWGVICATFLLFFLREGMRLLPLPADILGPLRLMIFSTILFAAVWFRRKQIFPKQREV